MQSFRNFNSNKNTFIAFSNAGGRLGQYDKFDYSESFLHGQGGGKIQKENLDENLNPRDKPQYIKTSSRTFFDPERRNTGLGDERNSPENIGIPDYHDSGYVNPRYTNEQANHAILLSRHVNENHPSYHDILTHYTSNSYNLNNELIRHHRMGVPHPEYIKSHLDYDDEDFAPEIHVPTLDKLIHSHKLPDNMTVYSGLHFHPNEHRGKIAVVPSFMSTSVSPHVAKDFGKDWRMYANYDNEHLVKNILRLHLPKGHPGLYTDNGSLFPGQGEIILPRGMRYQIGHRPTHIVEGNFDSHFHNYSNPEGKKQYHIYTGRVLPS